MMRGRKVVTRLELGDARRVGSCGSYHRGVDEALAAVRRKCDCARHDGVEAIRSSENARMELLPYLASALKASASRGGARSRF